MNLLPEEKVFKLANQLKNKSIKEIINQLKITNYNIKNKGHVGHVIENYFGVKKNNISAPDIFHLGIEIKSTPIRKLKNKKDFSLKERMVLNVINFNRENLDNFFDSSFYKKNQKVLMFFYLFNNETIEKDYFIQNFIYHDLATIPFNDLNIIKNDWKIIAKKIKKGEAHQLSERLTTYLGACPKGNKKESSLVSQPFSNIKAMRRAYSFKPHYLKYLLIKQEYQNKIETLEFNQHDNVINFVFEKISSFINFSVEDLCNRFNVNYKSKHKHYLILKKIFKVNNFDYVEEFLKENIKIRTYTINSNNKIQEEFPFLLVNPYEFQDDKNSFYDSELYNYFINTKFIFIGFKKDKQGSEYISKISYFEFPEKNLENLEFLWEDTRKKFNGDIVLTYKKTKSGKIQTINNLISKKDGYICHIRPKARDKKNEYLIPCGKSITKQCFWLNKEFVQQNFQDFKK